MQQRAMTKSRRATTAALIAAICMLWATSARAASPIVGVWSFSGGKIAIQAEADGTFTGKVVSPTRFTECTHPVGEEMWMGIAPQGDGSYWGGHRWFFADSDCAPNPTLGPTAWRVLGNEKSRFLRVCFSKPGSSSQPTIAADGSNANATFGCIDSARISSLPNLPPKKLSRYVHLPRAKNCIGSHKMRIHLHDPDNDPFAEIEVSLRSGKLHREAKIKRHRHNAIAVVSLTNLPKAVFTIRLKATTILGHHLSLRRKYHLCR